MSDDPIELGLHRSPTAAVLRLLDRLLGLYAEGVVDSESLSTNVFTERLSIIRDGISSAADAATTVRLGGECMDLCEDFQLRSRQYLTERETEFVGVIELLRGTLETVSGGALEFETRLAESADRLVEFTQLEDIRELKRQVLREVEQIKETTDERHRHDGGAFKRLSARIEELEVSLLKARDEASRDGLTGIANRAAFDRTLARLVDGAGKTGRSFVLVLVDLDDFKQINDTHGHLVGDRVLICAAQLLSQVVRTSDMVARFGGEEFAVLFDGVPIDKARARLEEADRQRPSSYAYEHDGEEIRVSFTYSGGLTEVAKGDRPEDVISRADAALYDAKWRGKNRLAVRRASRLQSLMRARSAGAA
jgi:diguanylate cyclase (GGDEF)-like protein